MTEVLSGIASAEVVVADMSQKNPNVFYEVGIAHSFKENVILLTQDTTDIPFDLRHLQHIQYEATESGLTTLTAKLKEAILRLQPEPPPTVPTSQETAVSSMTPVEVRHDLRRLLQDCRREWAESVVPEQTEVLIERFGKDADLSKGEVEEACKLLQPTFLAPWREVEELGFQVIHAGEPLEAAMPELMQALEQAYGLCQEQREPSLVVGHGPLLALRTWALWGAYALDYANWSAVGALLHTPVNFGSGKREPFSAYKKIHHPGVLHDNARLAARSIYDQTEEFASRRFGTLEALQGFVGLWLLATGIAYEKATANKWFAPDMFPTWALAAPSQFEGLATRLATNRRYAAEFSQAVALTSARELNRIWTDDLRDRFRDNAQNQFHGRLPELPAKFAE